jgi:hypothetical protein
LAIVTVALTTLWTGNALAFGVIIGLLFLPGAQLAASLLTLIWVQAMGAGLPDKKAALQTLGRITLWSIIGSVVGLLLMVGGCKMFSS